MNEVFLDGEIVRDCSALEQFKISMSGKNNRLELKSFSGSGKVYIYISGKNNLFSFGSGNTVKNDIAINFWGAPEKEPSGSQIIIGNGNYFNGSGNSIIGPLTTSIIIGNGNLFAGNIKIWGRNDHIVYDCNSKERLNNDADINLGSNNWICEAATILPGAGLKDNSILALGSILNKDIPKSNVLIAGVPAKIKREGVNWSRACNYEDIDFKNNMNILKRRKK